MRLVFMGTPEFAVPALDAVHGAGHEIALVYTQPDKPVGRGLELRAPPVKRRALELGLPVHQPEKLTASGELERLRELAPAALVVVAYGKILRRPWLELPRLGCVNIHSSLLPRWRGAAPIHAALLAGDGETGVTTMKLVEELDAGDILLQATTPIAATDDASTLHDRLAAMGAGLIVPTLDGLAKGTLPGIPQDPAKVTFAGKLSKEMEWLDPALEAGTLERRVRALNPWPGTSLWVRLPGGAGRLRVKAARAWPDIAADASKRGIIFNQAGMLLYGTSAGALQLLRVQWDGKKETDAAAFLNGLKGRGLELPFSCSEPASQEPGRV